MYETVDVFGSEKKCQVSSNKNSQQKFYAKGERFSSMKVTPGPSDYVMDSIMAADGICVLSNMKSSGRRAILNEKRVLRLDGNKNTPGPGHYQEVSDFGIYGSVKQSRPNTARK